MQNLDSFTCEDEREIKNKRHFTYRVFRPAVNCQRANFKLIITMRIHKRQSE
uniref:Uncharacterized protein n=1 Tax=Candidatus Kentrum sp. FW TaxID=2126338 RepID=A0A450TZ35_9GAMM|nr:MAG: hypothetical protein BECKFW1821C_GA0114237_10719 [Candidatus Kentron sp. FW]